jgi:hypothetical protein
MAAAESVGQSLIAGADWLLERMDEFQGALASVAQVTVGILSPMKKVIDFAREQSHKMIQWAREKLKYASKNLHSLLLKFVAFMGRVGEGLKKLIAAIVNPFGIVGFLAGTIWLALPECLKGPIIEFLLDVLDRFIAALPTNPLLGILWPVMKAALTGFVKRVKKVPLKEKIDLADKIAKIISGQSFEFAIGYLKGIVIGIWEELTSPFRALAAIFDLPEKITKFLNDLGTSFCEIVEKIRCFIATLVASAFGKLDDLLATLQEYLENPQKIVDLLTCAAEGALSAVESLGSTIADEMINIFKESDEKLGERLGKFTGSIIVQAVISFFTAGAGAGASIAAKIADALGAVGKAAAQVFKFITTQLSKLIKFVKNFVAKIGSAIVKGAKSLFGKMKGFFGKIFAWFKKVFGKLFAKLKKKFMLTAEERILWDEFLVALRAEVATHPTGITRRELRAIFKRHLQRAKKVAKWPAFITKHGPHWRLWVRRVKSIIPRVRAHATLDPATRLKQAMKAVKSDVKTMKALPGNLSSARLDASFLGTRVKYALTSLKSEFVPDKDQFQITGTANPVAKWRTSPKRPSDNDVRVEAASRHVVAYSLSTNRLTKTGASGSPPHWSAVQPIRSHQGGTSLYVKGHLVSGFWGPGAPAYTTPITRKANGKMEKLETLIWTRLLPFKRNKPVYKYDAEATGSAGNANLRTRYVGGPGAGATIPEERQLANKVIVRLTTYHYNGVDQWDRVGRTKEFKFKNVPPFQRGEHEPP